MAGRTSKNQLSIIPQPLSCPCPLAAAHPGLQPLPRKDRPSTSTNMARPG